MRKFLLLSALVSVGLAINAQQVLRPLSPMSKLMHEERPVVLTPVHQNSNISTHHPKTNRQYNTLKNLTGLRLNEQRIGSAGNLLTVDNYACNQIDANDATNAVIFIHRNDNTVAGLTGTNIGQYDFDRSTDGGNTFTSELGPFTSNPPDNENNVNGRFPQAVIYNPLGNTNADSAVMVYNGTWHNECPTCTVGSWVGQLYGSGKLGDTSSISTNLDTINNGVTAVATSMCQSSPGVFWNLNEDYSGTFATTSNEITSGIIVEKGIWDSNTKSVNWTATEIHQSFDSTVASNGTSNINISVESALNIAFDPSGKYGWIALLGDITTAPTDSIYHPIFWSSSDSGASWQGPTQVNLDSVPGLAANLHDTSYAGLLIPTGASVTTAFEGKLTVDYLGNPHFFTTVGFGGNGAGYAIYSGAGYLAVDITFSRGNSCQPNYQGWSAVIVDTVQTLQGNSYVSDAITEDNRPLVSRSKDGKKIFFFWLDTDYNTESADDNNYPNLFARGYDLAGGKSTAVFNLTYNDSLFGGYTTYGGNAGVFQPGANFPVVAPVGLTQGTSTNIPVVLTQLGYEITTGAQPASTDPVAFWYINNITFDNSDFTNAEATFGLTLIGSDTLIVHLGGTYIDSGAVVDTGCFNNGITLHVVADTTINVNTTGTYSITYYAEDSAGNVYASVSRTVLVVAAPVANFTYATDPQGPNYIDFTDLSTNSPTSWAWDFGNGTNSTQQNPSDVAFATVDTFNVCLTASNQWGTSTQICKLVTIDSVLGIKNVDLNQFVGLFPNPTNGKVTVLLNSKMNSDFTISVYDVLGQQLLGPIENKAGTTHVELDLSAYNAGTYLIKIQNNKGVAVKNLVLTHSSR